MVKLIEVVDSDEVDTAPPTGPNVTAEQAVATLRASPTKEAVSTLLSRLVGPDADSRSDEAVRLGVPSPDATRILAALVSHTVPDFWELDRDADDGQEGRSRDPVRTLIVAAFQSVNGIGALLSALGRLTSQMNGNVAETLTGDQSTDARLQARTAATHQTRTIVSLVDAVLAGDDTVGKMLGRIGNSTARQAVTLELVGLVGSNRISTILGAAEQAAGKTVRSRFVGGREYSTWLGRNISSLVVESAEPEDGNPTVLDPIGRLMVRGLGLGDRSVFVAELVWSLVGAVEPDTALVKFIAAVNTCSRLNRVRLVEAVFAVLAARFPIGFDADETELSTTTRAVGAIVTTIVRDTTDGTGIATDFLSEPAGLAIASSAPVVRAVIAAIASVSPAAIDTVVETGLTEFGDRVRINHSPALVHHFVATRILIGAGYASRAGQSGLRTLIRSTYFTDGISNRLSCSAGRARLLGMIVGTALSRLVDTGSRALRFEIDEMDSDEAARYFGLVELDDRDVMGLEQARPILVGNRTVRPALSRPTTRMAPPKPTAQTTPTKAMSALQIVDLDEAKPKAYDPLAPTERLPDPPVYIRDLISGLEETEKVDKHAVALEAAASVIRRQASQTAVSAGLVDVLDRLVAILSGLNDRAESDDGKFEQHRQEAITALVVVEPTRAAPCFVSMLFDADLSISQRIAIITGLGLGAVELAGIQSVVGSKSASSTGRLKTGETGRFAAMTVELEASIIQPIAAAAADSVTGPDAVKVETAVEMAKTRYKSSALARRHGQTGTSSTAGPAGSMTGQRDQNRLARIVADSFFFPLLARLWANYRAFGRASRFVSPFILPPLIKTLALLVDAAGPSSPAFPQMAAELWEVVLTLRTVALTPSDISSSSLDGQYQTDDGLVVADSAVLAALLLALLVLLDSISQAGQGQVTAIFELVPDAHSRLVDTLTWTHSILERGQVDPNSNPDQPTPLTELKSAARTTSFDIHTIESETKKRKSNDGPQVPGGIDSDRVDTLAAAVWTKCRDLAVARRDQLVGSIGLFG